MTTPVAALVYIMEKFLLRENVKFRKITSKTSSSIYFELRGPRFPYRLRISDHAEHRDRDFMQQADFHVRSIEDIRPAQTSITARVIRPRQSSQRVK
jgi:hypothetical protein